MLVWHWHLTFTVTFLSFPSLNHAIVEYFVTLRTISVCSTITCEQRFL
jgi:hypothetical protein